MAPQRLATLPILALTAIGLSLPLVLGLDCSFMPGPTPAPGTGADVDGGGNGSGDLGTAVNGDETELTVSAGIDRTATLDQPIVLLGSVSGGQPPYTIAWSPVTSRTNERLPATGLSWSSLKSW